LTDNNNLVGQRLALVRQAKGHTLRSLSIAVGIDYRKLADYEHGRRPLWPGVRARLAASLQVPVGIF